MLNPELDLFSDARIGATIAGFFQFRDIEKSASLISSSRMRPFVFGPSFTGMLPAGIYSVLVIGLVNEVDFFFQSGDSFLLCGSGPHGELAFLLLNVG